MIHCFLELRWIIVNANLAYKHFTVGKVNVIIPTFQMSKLSFSNVYILHYCKKWTLGLLGFERPFWVASRSIFWYLKVM